MTNTTTQADLSPDLFVTDSGPVCDDPTGIAGCGQALWLYRTTPVGYRVNIVAQCACCHRTVEWRDDVTADIAAIKASHFAYVEG